MQQCDSQYVVRYFGSYFKGKSLVERERALFPLDSLLFALKTRI